MEERVCQTIKEMLNDRGQNINTFTQLKELNIFETALVIYIDSEKLGVQHVKTVDNYLSEHKKETNILVYKSSITSFARNALDDLHTNIELFCLKELTYNVTHHKLVPKHILLGKEEKIDILNKYRTTETKMPLVPELDPICRYYNAKPGSMFKIIRPSNITGKSVYYRIVSKA